MKTPYNLKYLMIPNGTTWGMLNLTREDGEVPIYNHEWALFMAPNKRLLMHTTESEYVVKFKEVLK